MTRVSRRHLLQGMQMAGIGGLVGLSGCTRTRTNYAVYWSESTQLPVEYDTVLAQARTAGYDVEAPYYVNSKTQRGIHPTGLPALTQQFGPDYRIFGIQFWETETVYLEIGLSGDTPTAGLVDTRREPFGSFPPAAAPRQDWLVDRLRTIFALTENQARAHAEALITQIAEGTSLPQVTIDASVTVTRAYTDIADRRDAVTGSSTGGDGWYTETAQQAGQTIATVTIIVTSAQIRTRVQRQRYILKLDRLGGLYLRVELPAGEEIPESTYRAQFRELFDAVGLPAETVDNVAFEYEPSIW